MALYSRFVTLVTWGLSVRLGAATPTPLALENCQSLSRTARCTNTCLGEKLMSIPGFNVSSATASAILGSGPHVNTWDIINRMRPIQPEVCVVTVTFTPAESRNNISFGMFLPRSDKWNKRMLTNGNYAFQGEILWHDMAAGTYNGFATMSTNTGHGGNNMSFAKNADQELDWGMRAMNFSLPLAKQVIRNYYNISNSDKIRSYYTGCSTGGRQGLRQIMLDPSSFDALLIGAPAWDWNHLMALAAEVADFNRQSADMITTKTQLDLIWEKVLSVCDVTGFDSVADGIVSDIDACATNMSTIGWDQLKCNPDVPTDGCLTSAQIDVVKKFTSDGHLADGTRVYEGYTPSSVSFGSPETFDGWWARLNPQGFDMEYVRNFLDHDNWTWKDNAADIIRAGDDPSQRTANGATADNFTALANYPGKIILYHGMDDSTIPLRGSRRLWTEGLHNNTGALYFEMPGVGHCINAIVPDLERVGNPWYLGGVGIPLSTSNYTTLSRQLFIPNGTATEALNNTAHDALQALVAWAEGGAAPTNFIASGFPNQNNPSEALWWTNRNESIVCPYPQHKSGSSCVV